MQMNFKFWVLTIICLLSVSSSWGQEQVNYQGEWQGTAKWGAQNFTLTINLLQNGQNLGGQVFIENINKTKSATYALEGAVLKGKAILKGTKYINKKGLWCLPGIALTYEPNTTDKLKGKWKSNGGAKGCWIAGVGTIKLTKKAIEETIASREAIATRSEVSISDNDYRGNALKTELQKRTYYALIIGVQDYSDNNIIDLDQPVKDARTLKDELVADYNFKPENITFLQNPNRTTIIETFDQLTASVKNTDNLLIFYAGHGIWDEQIEQGYWLPSDAKKSSKAAWLSNGTIRDYIRAIDSKHTLLITDACFGGGILKTREAFTASKAMLEMYKLPSRRAMTSGALKTVPDKSVFIEYLIKALKNNDQPLISADQLFTSFKYNVINNSPNGQVPQYGVISQADDEGGDFIFLKK